QAADRSRRGYQLPRRRDVSTAASRLAGGAAQRVAADRAAGWLRAGLQAHPPADVVRSRGGARANRPPDLQFVDVSTIFGVVSFAGAPVGSSELAAMDAALVGGRIGGTYWSDGTAAV